MKVTNNTVEKLETALVADPVNCDQANPGASLPSVRLFLGRRRMRIAAASSFPSGFCCTPLPLPKGRRLSLHDNSIIAGSSRLVAPSRVKGRGYLPPASPAASASASRSRVGAAASVSGRPAAAQISRCTSAKRSPPSSVGPARTQHSPTREKASRGPEATREVQGAAEL